jgi:UDP-N-acetylmuramoyl-L-alanyl-D-glutamate--2,6-diaminopimelate ligase
VTARPLAALLAGAGVVPLAPVPTSLMIHGVRVDSRHVRPGDLFFALRGAVDGALHAWDAVASRAVAVVAESPARTGPGVPQVRVERSRWDSSPASGSVALTRR